MEKDDLENHAMVSGAKDSIQYFAKKMLIAEVIKKAKKKKILKFWRLFEAHEATMKLLISERVNLVDEVKAYHLSNDEHILVGLVNTFTINAKKYRKESAKFKNEVVRLLGKSIDREVQQIIVDVDLTLVS